MDQEEPHGSNQSSEKRQNDENNERGSDAAIVNDAAVAVNQVQTADILKLDIDCFEELFDFLPLKDLAAMSRACKRLQQVAGYCFQQTYLGSTVHESNSILGQDCRPAPIKMWKLLPFIQKIEISSTSFSPFIRNFSQFKRLKQIYLPNLSKHGLRILLDKISLSKIEVLRIGGKDLGNVILEIVNQCVKLKHLEIVFGGGESKWLDRKYPTLEYFKIRFSWMHSIDGIAKFLELNPNIRTFAIDSQSLRKNRDKMMTANIKLDNLAIDVNILPISKHDKFKPTCDLLNELHKIGFYTKLQFYAYKLDQENIRQLVTLKGLVKLHVRHYRGAVTLTGLTNLEELYVSSNDFPCYDGILFANDLPNLKRIHLNSVSIDNILPLIRRCVNLQKIRVDMLQSGAHFNMNTNVVDLVELNRERKKLQEAAKIILYVEENTYLATKWTTKEIDFELIRISRKSSFEWQHDFYAPK